MTATQQLTTLSNPATSDKRPSFDLCDFKQPLRLVKLIHQTQGDNNGKENRSSFI
jgi:hypothetical protein